MERRDSILLAVLAVALYAPLMGWGVPYATGPDRVSPFSTDDILPLGPLAEMHNAFVETKPDRNYGYPFWHYFVDAVAQSPYLAYLWVSGGMDTPAPTFPFGLRDPVGALRALTFIGRAVTVLMGASVVVFAYWFSRLLWDRTTGLVAATLTLLNGMMVYYARTGNLDVPAFFWTAGGAVIFAMILKHGLTVRRIVWLGVFAGLAMATKDQALVVFLPLGCALLAPSLNRRPGEPYPLRTLLVGVVVSIAAYVIGTGMLVDPRRHFIHVGGLLFHPEWVTVATGSNVVRHPNTIAGFFALGADYLTKLADTTSRPVLLAAIAGAIVATWRAPRYLVFVMPLLLLFLMLAVPTGIVVRRYFLPALLFVDAFAACLIVAMWRSRFRGLGTAVLLVLCGWRLAGAADLSYSQLHDSRYAAAEWLAAHAHAGERVEYFGSRASLPHLPAAIQLRRIPEEIERKGETSETPTILRYLAVERPHYVLVIPDWTSRPGTDRSNDVPEAIYRALLDGSAGYREGQYFPPTSLLPTGWRPPLDYPTVSPPVRVFARADLMHGATASPEQPRP